jgi:ribosomal protein S18 acetylase RimI-like enzyme
VVRISRPTPDRFDETLALLQATDHDAYGGTDWTEAELREEWETLDLERDAWLVDLGGRLAGVMHLCERRGGTFISDGYVHPELRGRGVGSTVLDLVEARARERVGEVPDGSRAALHNSHLVGDETAPALLSGKGFERARSFYRMVADLDRVETEAEWPDGMEVRPLDVVAHGRLLHAADETAFAEEWGHQSRSYEEWAERVFGRSQFDPALVVVAWDGDEIAGFSLNYPKRMGDWGWVGVLGVVPPWRRRGLGLALLRESFTRFRATGETLAALGVDSANPTGATRLYERAGMRVLWRADVWEKELRPGGA